jgi:hypothetical protein
VKKAIAAIAVLSLPLIACAVDPYKVVRIDYNRRRDDFKLEAHQAESLKVRVYTFLDGAAVSPGTGTVMRIGYGTNYWDSTSMVTATASGTTNNYVDVQFTSAQLNTNGTFFAEIQVTNSVSGRQYLWSEGKIDIRKSPLGSSASPLVLNTLAEANAPGDVAYVNSSTNWTVLPIGSSGQSMQVSAGFPAWGDMVPVAEYDAVTNSLQAQITSNDTDITSLQAQITSNDTDIAANAAAISAGDTASSNYTDSVAAGKIDSLTGTGTNLTLAPLGGAPTQITASGAGTAAYNQTYSDSGGTKSGETIYVGDTDATRYLFAVSIPALSWCLDTDTNITKRQDADYWHPSDIEGAYITEDGVAPAPTVSATGIGPALTLSGNLESSGSANFDGDLSVDGITLSDDAEGVPVMTVREAASNAVFAVYVNDKGRLALAKQGNFLGAQAFRSYAIGANQDTLALQDSVDVRNFTGADTNHIDFSTGGTGADLWVEDNVQIGGIQGGSGGGGLLVGTNGGASVYITNGAVNASGKLLGAGADLTGDLTLGGNDVTDVTDIVFNQAVGTISGADDTQAVHFKGGGVGSAYFAAYPTNFAGSPPRGDAHVYLFGSEAQFKIWDAAVGSTELYIVDRATGVHDFQGNTLSNGALAAGFDVSAVIDGSTITTNASGEMVAAGGGGGNPIDARAATNTVDMGGFGITSVDYLDIATNTSPLHTSGHWTISGTATGLYFISPDGTTTNYME